MRQKHGIYQVLLMARIKLDEKYAKNGGFELFDGELIIYR